jgi:hypothetical protein
MFIKILEQINPNQNFYYVQVVSPMSDVIQIASSDHPLNEGQTYRGTPSVHWVRDSEDDASLAHFKVFGKQKSMEQTA